jgi:ABC-type Mn2+/Zn2+ transport system permease subunit
MGVALPQISSCGIAFAFALQGWGLLPHAHDSAGEHTLAFLGSAVFTLAAILLLAVLARRGRGSVETRIGTACVLAGALSILLLVKNPTGEHGMLELLHGQVIAISNFELVVTAGVFALVVATLWMFRRNFSSSPLTARWP